MAIAVSPYGTQIATGSKDHSIVLWRVSSGEQEAVLYGHTGNVSTLCYDSTGSRLMSGSWDRLVIIWDPLSYEILHWLGGSGCGHEGAVQQVCFAYNR